MTQRNYEHQTRRGAAQLRALLAEVRENCPQYVERHLLSFHRLIVYDLLELLYKEGLILMTRSISTMLTTANSYPVKSLRSVIFFKGRKMRSKAGGSTMKKRIWSLMLAAILCLSLIPTAFASGFTDVKPGGYCYVPVLWAVDQGITSGTSATTFSPQDTCTISQILTFLWRASGQPTPSESNPFSDVAEKDYFLSAACWASENGLVSGTILNPNAPCTRSMVVTYLWKLSGSPTASSTGFTDVPAGAEYAAAVAWAVEQGITSGTSDSAFSPQDTCTRGQIVTFLYRYSGSPEVEPVLAFYDGFADAPDFGALALAAPIKSEVKDNIQYYYYDIAAISAQDPNREFITILSEYEKLLESNGFSFTQNQESEKGVFIYLSSTTTLILALNLQVLAIGLRSNADLATTVTSNDGKYYANAPGVPDLGAACGILPTEVSPRADGWTYTYDKSNVTKEQINKYVQILDDEEFVVTDAGVNMAGMTYVQVSKGKTDVMIVEYGDTLMVAVYSR